MNKQFDERLLETTWQEIEFEIKKSGQIGPLPGFSNRWKVRLKEQHKIEQRRQAWIFVGINVVAAFIILSIIGVLNFPKLSNSSGFFVDVIGLLSKMVVYIQMISSVLSSLLRTIPGLVPSAWWMSIIVSFIALVVYWSTTIKNVVGKQGVSK